MLPVVLQQICDCFPGFTANLLLCDLWFYSRFVAVLPAIVQQICEFSRFYSFPDFFCLFPPGGHAVERPRISSTVVPEAAGESSEASETSARQPARLTTSLLLCLSQGIFLITASARLCAFCCTTIVDMVAFLYSVVGVEYERNTAGFIQWLVLSMKETLHVRGVLLPKSHIAAFINVLIENNVGRLFMVLILICINQCSSLTSLCM